MLRPRSIPVVLVGTVVLAACGSTVSDVALEGPVVTRPGENSSGPVTVGGDAGTSDAGTGGAPAGATTGTAVGGSATGNAGAGSTGSGTGAITGRRISPARGPGITATTIQVGFAFNSERNATAIALGAAGAASTYDVRDVANAVIAYANRHGGFAGRRLKPIYFDYASSSDTSNREVGHSEACAHWTQDNKVFTMSGGHDILNACAEKAHAIPLYAGSATTPTYRRFPHLVDPHAIRLDRLGVVTTNGLYKSGYFTGKLGLVTWDHPDYRYAISHGYLPALAALNIKPVDIAYLGPPQSPGALPDMAAQVAGAVNKFRSQGIDHVIIQDGPAGFCANGCQTLTWMNAAKSQRWYPRYGQNANNAPGDAVMPSDQMDRALAVDQADTQPKHDAGWRTNVTREKCFKIQADAGYPVRNSVDMAFAALYCDYTFFLQRVLNGLSLLSADAFIQAVEALGTSFPTAFVYGSKFRPGKRDGGSMVRTSEYFDSCKCLKYKGPPYYAD